MSFMQELNFEKQNETEPAMQKDAVQKRQNMYFEKDQERSKDVEQKSAAARAQRDQPGMTADEAATKKIEKEGIHGGGHGKAEFPKDVRSQ